MNNEAKVKSPVLKQKVLQKNEGHFWGAAARHPQQSQGTGLMTLEQMLSILIAARNYGGSTGVEEIRKLGRRKKQVDEISS